MGLEEQGAAVQASAGSWQVCEGTVGHPPQASRSAGGRCGLTGCPGPSEGLPKGGRATGPSCPGPEPPLCSHPQARTSAASATAAGTEP